mmetsp:Transcript_35177/g.53977  ORF Transcript_35177/g.53977 Transcript_35177/m.53977 type:complete len:88 (+) Transcript_35177:405-668(+)
MPEQRKKRRKKATAVEVYLLDSERNKDTNKLVCKEVKRVQPYTMHPSDGSGGGMLRWNNNNQETIHFLPALEMEEGVSDFFALPNKD